MAKKRCWAHSSLDVICWGKQQNKQDLSVKTVAYYSRNERTKIKNRFIWFKKWIIERQTYNTLCRDSDGYSKDTLQRTFYKILERSPTVKIIKENKLILEWTVLILHSSV
ncbi:MAG: hypothetical protein R2801_10385 [Chitinophagales bacterium]